MVATLGIFAVVGLIAVLAPLVSWPNLARAHSADDAALRALRVTPGTLSPSFNRTVYLYAVTVADTVTQITVAGTPDGDGTVAYQEANGATLTDADMNTAGQQVDIPTDGKRINVVVTHETDTRTYAVLVIREGPVATDTIGLMALYNSAGGANWTTKANWGSSEPLNMWHGVTTDSDGRVIYLILAGNGLVGTLPAALGNLTHLSILHLYTNQLSGEIPASLGSLTSLTKLYLNNNQLSGRIPASLGNLTNLTLLYMYANQLSGEIPASLGSLTSLTKLYLNNNQLSGRIPASLGNLTNLTLLYMYANQLSGEIPASLGSLTSLTQLYLNNNQLSGEIPASLGSLTSLTQLYLNNNQLSGRIPTSLGSLTNLQGLSLAGNKLSGPIPDLGNLTRMLYLYLWDNQLTGEIPASLGNLTSLIELYLNQNQLSGTVPDLSRLTNLQYLYLWSNQLSGEIPDWLGNLTSLTGLSLARNQLSGPIPSSLGSLTNLTRLYLNNNQLSGEIPDLSRLTNLQYLYLWGNQLSGEIPASLDSLTSLTELSLARNKLSGPIPDLSRLTNVRILHLNHNQLTGPIPDLSRFTQLQGLSLQRNQLTGEIPAWLGSLSKLEAAFFHSNQLTGEIPASLGHLSELKGAYFAGNALTGCVPHGLRYLLAAEPFEQEGFEQGVDPHDFIGVDANGDGDTDDLDDTPGLNLPFCMLSGLAFSGVTLVPSFASGAAAYTANVANTVESTTVTATLADVDAGDRLSIRKGTTSYDSGDTVPLDVGSNEITIEVTPSNSALLKQTYTVQLFREGSEASDMAALMALYNSAGGANWTDKTNWDSAQSLNTWYGVTTSGGRVTNLDLSANNLAGTLPAELGGLTQLTSLDLSGNRLRGMIPDLRGLTQLQGLSLQSNQLSGPIPDWLGDFTNLTTLNLSGNQLSRLIPASLGSLNRLQALYLNGNQLSGEIPASLGDLTRLRELSLRNNRLSGPIPASLDSLFSLQLTRFAGNGLTGCVPDGLRDLLTASEFMQGVPPHDFIAVDANNDGDTNDVGDTPGLNLPFCALRSLSLSGGVTLEPDFASGTVAYTASVPLDVASTTVRARLHNNADTVSIMKGTDTYTNNASVPLDVGVNVLTIEVTTADGSPTPHSYTVTVTRQTNPPPVFDEGATTTRGVVENTAADVNIGDPVAATDPDSGDTLTYSLDDAGAESFAIDATTGQLQTKAALDYETRNSYRVTVSVRDSKDDQGDADERADATIAVTLLVAEVNEEPAFPSMTDTRTIRENTAAGVSLGAPFTATDPDTGDTLTYSLSGNDSEFFAIDPASGRLQTKAALDYEDTPSYTVTVTATDPSGVFDTVNVTITVDDVDEPGALELSTVQPVVGTALIATLTDPDVPDLVSGVTWSWESSTNRSNWAIISGRNLGHLHAGCRRRGPLPAGHRLLRRRRRLGQERPGGLGQSRADTGVRQQRALVPVECA